MRVIAIDWSGAKTGAARKIWLAEARDGELLRLEAGRCREQIVEHLIELMRSGDGLAVGLDFGFSFPSWFLHASRYDSAPEAWRALAADGHADALLAACDPPFWGAPRKRRPDGIEHYRRTELAVAEAEGVRPKSVFQIGGAGCVGTGSLRGMCALHALRSAGFAIWPFDGAGAATAFEIYPRLFTGRMIKSSEGARRRHLTPLRSFMPRAAYEAAVASDDAFDAAISVLALSEHAADLASLPRIDDPQLRDEGIIWWPEWRAAHPL